MPHFVTAADRERLQALLEEGEELLWVGKPEPTGLMGWSRLCFWGGGSYVLLMSLMGCYFIFSHTPQAAALLCGILLLFLLLPGLALCLVPPLLTRQQTRRWLYALTQRRALVLRHDTLRDWPLTPHMVQDYTPGACGSIVFSYKPSWLFKNKPRVLEEGFLHCREAGEALEQLERLLAGRARPLMAPPAARAHMQQVFRDAQAMRLAAARGQYVLTLLLLLIAAGCLGMSLWWRGQPEYLIRGMALILALSAGLISAARLRTAARGRQLLARQRQSKS